MAKRKKFKRKKGTVKRWGENPVPISGSGPNMVVVDQYKARAKSLEQEWEGDHGPPTRVREEWEGAVKARGYQDWFKVDTEVPGVWHYFHGTKHFLVKHFPLLQKYKRSKVFNNKDAMMIYLLTNRIRFTEEFEP